MSDLLGGAIRGKTRPRGFIDWKPHAATLALLDQVQSVLDEYAAYLPLTIRQAFYRLVGAHSYEKTEQAYERLGDALNRARRAKLIPIRGIYPKRRTGEDRRSSFSHLGLKYRQGPKGRGLVKRGVMR